MVQHKNGWVTGSRWNCGRHVRGSVGMVSIVSLETLLAWSKSLIPARFVRAAQRVVKNTFCIVRDTSDTALAMTLRGPCL